jgi:hypothetical protein
MKFRHHCLVGAILNPKVNPGDILILRGMEYLITQAEKNLGVEPLFSQANLFDRLDSEDDNLTWSLVNKRAQTAIFAGTPQFNKDGCGAHVRNLIERMKVAKSQGLLTAYFWLGSGYTEHSYTKEEAVSKMLAPNLEIFKELSQCADFIITRDEITNELLTRGGVPNTRFLDCVFYTPEWFSVTKQPDEFNLIVLRGKENPEECKRIAKASLNLEQFFDGEYPLYYLVHEEREYLWWQQFIPKERLICVCLPNDLLRIYSKVHQMISFRVHGSVVALSLGKQVMNVLNDSRSNILETVGVSSISQSNYPALGQPVFSTVPNILEIKEKEKQRFFDYWKQIAEKLVI